MYVSVHMDIHLDTQLKHVQGHRHAAWTWTCSMDTDMDMQHGQRHGHVALIWTFSKDMDMQNGTWTCSIYIDTQHGHGNAAWTWKCGMDMEMQHGHRHAAWTWTTDRHQGCRNANKKLSPASAVPHHGQSGTTSHG
jgi:hypothetical protein